MQLSYGAAVLVLLAGCGAMREAQAQRLGEKFREQFACEVAFVTPPPDFNGPQEYRIRGCDQVAFYTCRTIDAQTLCVLEHHRPLTTQEREAAAQRDQPPEDPAAKVQEQRRAQDAEFAAARAALVAHPESAQALGEVHADDWHLQISRVASAHVLWRLATTQSLSPAPCRPTITHDGHVIPTETISAHADHEVAFLIQAQDFDALAKSTSIRGALCGIDFHFDDQALQSLRALASR